MHVLVIPSEMYLPDAHSLQGLFQKDQIEALSHSDIEIGVLSIEISSIKKIFDKSDLIFKKKLTLTKDGDVNIVRIRSLSLHNRYFDIYDKIWISKGKKAFKKYVSKFGIPDIIHAHNVMPAGLLASKLSDTHSISYVITEHSSRFIEKTTVVKHIDVVRKAYQGASGLISVSETLKTELIRKVGINEFMVLPNVLNRIFEQKNISKEQGKTNKRHFFSLGSLSVNKGFYELLESFSKSFKGQVEKHLTIGGYGSEYKNLLDYAQELGISTQVTFTGLLSKEQVIKHMNDCDVFVLASHYETFGVVYIEALACGKPVIATSCGGPENIINSSNGLLVEPKNISELSKALSFMAENFSTYDSKKLRNDCILKYGSKKFAQVVSNYYKEILMSHKT